ncbi:hypothetical protein J6590_015767 [Homalodisca vitripennis]|nr:hypothetical protein J6590_015767 [Homalodisca vitripennis]
MEPMRIANNLPTVGCESAQVSEKFPGARFAPRRALDRKQPSADLVRISCCRNIRARAEETAIIAQSQSEARGRADFKRSPLHGRPYKDVAVFGREAIYRQITAGDLATNKEIFIHGWRFIGRTLTPCSSVPLS